jgi:bifunctional non-homologous end joining protein LigD
VFYEKARGLSLEGIVSKRADAPYAPTNRGLWVKIKCLHREEIRGRRLDRSGRFPPRLGWPYYDPQGHLVYAGRAGTGIKQAELGRL